MIKKSSPHKTFLRFAVGLLASVTACQAAADIYPIQLLDYQIDEGNIGNTHSDPRAILGNSDQQISLGKNGWLAVKMGRIVYDGDGIDLTVDAGGQGEEYEVFVGDSLRQWTSVGRFHQNAAIDLNTVNLDTIRYVYILDLHSTGIAPTQTPGADIVLFNYFRRCCSPRLLE